MTGDTIFALSSGRPPAAVAVIRVSGPSAHDAGRALAGTLPEARSAAVRELRDPGSGTLLDEALVLRFDGPASATGEDIVEFQCHGGRAIVDAVLGVLTSLNGLRPAQPGEFTRRAFDNGRIDLTEAEGLADLIEAETETQRKAALAIAEGGLRQQIGQWQERVLALSAQAERAIDYDEDDDGADPELQRDCVSLADELAEWLDRPRAERLRDGIRLVIAGPPNAGKSSLLNAIVGDDRAIVTEVAGTTRDHIDVPLALDGLPFVVTDTAGLRDAPDRVEAIGVERAKRWVEAADILLWLGAFDAAPGHPRLIRVHPKADLSERGDAPTGTMPVSAITGEGLTELLRRVADEARGLIPGEGILTLNQRQAKHIAEAREAMDGAAGVRDLVLVAEHLRGARMAFDRLSGRAGVEDVLDALFSRFCLGK